MQRPRTWTSCAIAVIVALGVGGCADDGPAASTDDPPAGSAVPATSDLISESTIAAATAAAIDIRTRGCGPREGFGTGAMIDDDLALTAAHVVAGATSIEAVDTGGLRVAGDVVYFDPALDIAAIRLASSIGRPVELRADEARAGERGVVVLPRWLGGEMQREIAEVDIRRTVNISTTDIYLEDAVDRSGFEVEGSIDPGDSGALVTTADGGVGIVWARSRRSERRAWAIDLPPEVLDPVVRSGWNAEVDNGDCIG